MAKSTRRRVKRSRKARRQRGGVLTLLKFTLGANSTPTLVGPAPDGFSNFVGGPGGSLNFNTPTGSTINNISFMGGANGSTPIVNTKVFAPQTPTGIGMSIGAVSKLVPRGLMVRGGTPVSAVPSAPVRFMNLNNANLNLGTGTTFSIYIDVTLNTRSLMGPTGAVMGPTGAVMGPTGTLMGPTGAVMGRTGTLMGPTGAVMGPR